MSSQLNKLYVLSGVAAGVLAALALPVESRAQQPGANVALEEIVVTSRRRMESLQDVPLAITAFSGVELEARGVESISNLNAMAPNLSVQGGAGRGIESAATFRVRGMPGVAMYIDGIDQSSSTGLFTMGVLEVERIEVLRGPQGTLFGTSALGGAIQYVSRLPGTEFGGRVQARTGSLNRRDIQASIDVPLTDNLLTKFTMASMSRDGFMSSVDSGAKYGDINDQFYRADIYFTPSDRTSFRYSYDVTDQDRMGGARAVWEIGPMNTFNVGGVVVNSNAAAQAYANAYGLMFDCHHVCSGHPGGLVGKYETRVAHQTPGLQLEMARHTFDFSYDINDTLSFRTLAGRRTTERRLMVDFDSDSRVSFADRQDNDWIRENSVELQLIGTHGDRNQFDWVVGAYRFESSTRGRFPTIASETLNCDLQGAAAAPDFRGVTDLDRVSCFNDRMRALNMQDQFVAVPGMSRAEIASMWTDVVALNPNHLGVTPTTIAGTVGANDDQINFNRGETTAYFADLSYRVTDRLTLAAGLRQQKDETRGLWRVQRNDMVEPFPWNNLEYHLRDPFGYNAITSRFGPTEYEKTTKRGSIQYNWTDDIMTYFTYADGYGPGGRSVLPGGILTLGAGGTATSGFLRDVHNAGLSDLPAEMLRGEQTVDSYELGLRADWLDRRLRTNVTGFYTDWRNMTGSTYVATIFWDTNGDGFANVDGLIPCAVRCTSDGQYEILYFPNLLTSAVDKAEASGLEIEMTWLGGTNYRFGLNIGLLDTEFKKLGDAGLGTVPAYGEGDSFAGAPEMTANIWGQYDWTLRNGGALSGRLDYTWTDDYTTFAGGPLQRTQKSFGLLNARVEYDPGTNWSLVVAGTNLTNEYYSPAFFYTVSQQLWQGSVGRPREAYLGLNFRF
jgi:iron complex outermembrane recepter protein